MNKNIKLLLTANYWHTFGFTLLSPLYAVYVTQQLNGSEFEIGLSYSVYGFSAGILMIIAGRVEDSISKYAKQILTFGYVLLAIASFGYLLVDSIYQLMFLQMIYAMAVAIYVPMSKTLFSKLEDDGKESSEWAIMDGGNFLIIGFSSLIGGYLLANYSFDVIFIGMGISQLFAALLVSRVAPSRI
ncbi:TPA: MFS transporter [Candidatus Saccharibacteria bacterium]|nr:MFS transporter [Candidatus Saccharibacteria bacterium]HIO88043.1 MFS transporter [Candidatus Saccharibacteria bacterium]